MGDEEDVSDIGFLITKPPVESGLVAGAMAQALAALEAGKKVGVFLISDGVWLVKKGQKNPAAETFAKVMGGGASVIASPEHLKGAGIGEDEMVEGVEVPKNTYRSLVETVMEKWTRVVVI